MTMSIRVACPGGPQRRCIAAQALKAIDAAALCGFDVEQPCAGRGRCSGCRVRFVDGAPPPAVADLERLGDSQCAAGWRLACQTWIRGDADLEVPATAAEVAEKSFGSAELPGPRTPLVAPLEPASLGYAVDLGTTTLALALVDLKSTAVLASRAARNPQARWGDDVIARILAADGRVGVEQTETLRKALTELSAGVLESAGVPKERVRGAVLCGNSFMTHSVLGIDPRSLGRAPFRGAVTGMQERLAGDLGLHGADDARAFVLPPVESHVGGDAVAAMLAVDFDRSRRPAVLLDLGTNTEIAVTDGRRILVASAAAGPAFEGGGIGCGTRAVWGAIDRIATDECGGLLVRVRGGGKASGICGTGLVDAAACLLDGGALDKSGRLLRPAAAGGEPGPLLERLVGGPPGRHGVVLANAEESGVGSPIVLTAADLRQLQLAKGAIAAAATTLLELLGVAPDRVDMVHVAGAFGSSLRVETALRIGLLPTVEPERVSLAGDAAGVGARKALCDAVALKRALALAERAEHVELARQPGYTETFAAAMAYPR